MIIVLQNQAFAIAESQIEYNAVLTDLRAKRDNLDGAIAALEAALGLQVSMAAPGAPGGSSTNTDLGPGAFLGMTIVEAVAKLLVARRRALRTEEIVTELRNGGIAFSSESPINTVGSVLNRDFKNGGEIVSVGRGTWGLAEWHPRLRKKRPRNGSAPTLDEIVDAAVDESAESVGLKPTEPEQKNEKPKAKTLDELDDDIPF